MKLGLVYRTPHLEILIATAMLTTTSGAKPSRLFDRLHARRGALHVRQDE